jgi:KDO2-lipid IV(A) lauroyltransferase
MNLQNFFNSAEALRVGLWLGRHVPLRVGHALADGLTAALARRRDAALYRTLFANLQVALGPEAATDVVHHTAGRVLRNTGRTYFSFYRAFAKGPQAVIDAVDIQPQVFAYLDEIQHQGRGALIVGSHLSGFDMGAFAFAFRGYHIAALAFANPTSGYDMQNEMRQAAGIEWLPIDVSVLRKAITALRGGALIVTGVDRPDPFGGGELMPFFGRPARLPVGHVRLALQTHSPIAIVVPEYVPQQDRIRVSIAALMEMEEVGSRQENVMHNARRVLTIIERAILAHPDQWQMFYPVWEERLTEADR